MATTFTYHAPKNVSGEYAVPESVTELQTAVNALENIVSPTDSTVDLSGATKSIFADSNQTVGLSMTTSSMSLYGVMPVVTTVTTSTVDLSSVAYSNNVIALNRALGIAVTLPDAESTNLGTVLDIVFIASVSGGSTTITAGADDLFIGSVLAQDTDTSDAVRGDSPNGSSHRIMTFNGSTQGGLIGTQLRLRVVAADRWLVEGVNRHTGAWATIFS